MGHPYIALTALIDYLHPSDAWHIVVKTLAYIGQEAGIDLVDYLQMTRKRFLEDSQRPLFQRLGQESVVGVSEGVAGDLPRIIPIEAVLVEQQAHQLGH